MRKKLSVFCLLVTMALAFFAPKAAFSIENGGQARLKAILRSVSRPRLIFPENKAVDLSDRKTLKFQWALTASTLVALDYIEFYLYKGEAVREENLVFGKRLANNEYSIEIDSALFEDGQFYIWGVKQFFFRREKSNESFILFKVYK